MPGPLVEWLLSNIHIDTQILIVTGPNEGFIIADVTDHIAAPFEVAFAVNALHAPLFRVTPPTTQIPERIKRIY